MSEYCGICVDRRQAFEWLPRSNFLFAISLVVFGLTLIEAIDAFELPFESLVGSSGVVGGLFTSSIQLEATLGYPGLFVLMLLESASLPVPSEVILPLAGYLVFLGKMGFIQAVIVASVGGLVGAYIDYYAARLLGRPLLVQVLKRIRVSELSLIRAERWFNRSGLGAVLLARFVPLIRTLISFPAGLLKMDSRAFGVVTMIGTLGWSALLVYTGYRAGGLWRSGASSTVGTLDTLIVFILLALSTFYILLYLAGYQKGKSA
jgi:membrane protein DedA with SNARE-associated domain